MFKIFMIAACIAAVTAVEPYGSRGGGGRGGREGVHDAYQKQDYHTEPHYSFEYQVEDPHTHDIKSHKEERKGDHTQGVYELIEPDGSKRTVEYHVDGKSGFNVVVNRQETKHPVSNSKGSYSSEGYSGGGSSDESSGRYSEGAADGASSGSYIGGSTELSSGLYSGSTSGGYRGGSFEASAGSYKGGSAAAYSGRQNGGSSGTYDGKSSVGYTGGLSGSYRGITSEGFNSEYNSGTRGQAGSILAGSHSRGYKVNPESDYEDNHLNEEHRSFAGSEEYSSGGAVLGALGFAGHKSGASQNVYDSGKSSHLNRGSLTKDFTGSSGAGFGNNGYSSFKSLGTYAHGGSSGEATSFTSFKSYGSPYSQTQRENPAVSYSDESTYSSGSYQSDDASSYSLSGGAYQDHKPQVSYHSGGTSSPGNGYNSGRSSAGYGSSSSAYKGDGTATSSVKFSTKGANIITKTNHMIPAKYRDSHY